MRRKKRVRLHLVPDTLPSVEGLLVAKRPREYVLAVASLIVHADAKPAQLESRFLVVPRERVAFYEVLT